MAYCFNLKCPAPDLGGEGNFCIHCGASLRLDDRYEALRSLKSYANGATFVCHDRQQRQCVIKKMSLHRPGQPSKSWEREIKAIKTISTHPQIPDLWEYFFDLDHHFLYLVQEFIEGKSIDQEFYDGPKVEAFLLETLPLLHFIHSHGVTHRDLNPQNLLRSSRSGHRLFLVDLSTAKVSAKTSLATAGTTIGSAAYAAPEQLHGQSYPASDLYSLGLIAIHLLTQMNPLDLLSGADGIAAWQDYLPEPISPLLVQVINGMVAESLTDRYSQALTIIKLLNPNFQEGDSFNFEQGMPLSAVIKIKPSWKQRKQWQGHRNTITSLEFSRDGTELLSTSADQLVKVWNSENITARQFEGHRSVVSQGLFGQQQIISGSWDYEINVWSEDRQELTSELTGHSGWILAVALSADGSKLVSGGSDRQLKLWDLAQERELVTLQGHGQPIQAVAFAHQENLLISGDQSGLIKIWNSETFTLIATLTELHHQAITAMRCHPHNPWAITASADATVKVWQIPTGKILQTLSGHMNGVVDMDLCDRGQLLATIGDDHKINLWYLPKGEIMESIFLQDFALTAIALHPQGTKFAIGGKNGQIQLWHYH